MSDEKPPKPPQQEQIDIRTEPERVADEKIEALERELAALQPGVAVIIERLKPSWCKGQLEKLTVDDDGLDLDYLIETWGGHLLSLKIVGTGGRIRGSHSVELYSFEPRRYGKVLKRNKADDHESDDTRQTTPVVRSEQNDLLPKILEMMNNQRQSEVDTLRAILLAQQSQPQPVPDSGKSAMGSISEIAKTAQALTQLKELFRSEPMEPSDDNQFPGQIFEVLKMVLDKRANGLPHPEQKPARLTGPAISQGPKQPIAAVTRLNTPTDISRQVSEMSPDRAADTIMTALGQMDPKKQQKAMTAFLQRFQAAERNAEKDDEQYDDEEDDNEGDEYVER